MHDVSSALDDPRTYDLDGSRMFERLARSGDRLLTEWGRGGAGIHLKGAGPISSLIIAGVGGSAVAGDYVAALARGTSPVPVEVVRDFHMPAWTGPRTMVIACSHSGATPETISAYVEARTRGARLGVITSGGPLQAMAQEDGVPCWLIEADGPPRAASTAILGALLRVACEAGVFCVELPEVATAAAAYKRWAAEFAPSRPTATNAAKTLAASLAERIPFVIGAGHLVPAATRFKNQMAENGKALSAMDSIPEAGHNLVVGLTTAAFHHERITLVMIEGSESHHFHVKERFRLLAEHFEAARVPVHRIRIAEESLLAEQLAANAWADFTSAYVSLLHGHDPTPIPQIDAIKATLAAGFGFSVESAWDGNFAPVPSRSEGTRTGV